MEVDGDEICGVGFVGVDATDLGSGEDHELGLFSSKEGIDISLAGEIELGVGSEEEIGESKLLELADDGGADKTTVTSDEDLSGLVGKERVHSSSCERKKTELGLWLEDLKH